MLHAKSPEVVVAFVLHAESLDTFDASDGTLRLVLSLPRRVRDAELDARLVVTALLRGIRPNRLHFSPNPALARTPRAVDIRDALKLHARALPARLTEDSRLFERLENRQHAAPYAR